ncbi:unnamed protein product [Mycena citricolor]|uniref:Uncharacterized protein n=1 Tax=Mycena citricolor TaxID=2018698 RepID=A0AAD2JV11_9AGAR|nr:unnamed protein product [Mycena citricolor]CAK5263213.1 unnamed protein product [Mycena citricolor]
MGTTAVFNPNIVDASIRDVALCLTVNQKADVLLNALGHLPQDGPSRPVFDNAIQSCLQIATLSPHYVARARIMRARRRLNAGLQLAAQEDLQAALAAEPDNPEAKALLHRRSISVEKLLAPLPTLTAQARFSNEIWREIALWLPRRDLKTLLSVPNALSRVASRLLFRRLDLHLSVPPDHDVDAGPGAAARRTADILTRIIEDASFSGSVRTLCVFSYATGKDESMAFQIGMLSNAIYRLVNLRNVHISGSSENTVPLLRLLQQSSLRIRGLSIVCPDAPVDLTHFDCKTLHSLSYSTREGNPTSTNAFLAQNRSLRTVSLHNMSWVFPVDSLSLRNLTSISFSGHFPSDSNAFAVILSDARQLDSLSLTCTIECLPAIQFRHATSGGALPFLRFFSLTVSGAARRPGSADLFPAVADFLRARSELVQLSLIVREEADQRTAGFDAAVWGVLPTLTKLRTLTITYPRDLAAGLAAWLIPRSVRALTLDFVAAPRDPASFLDQIRPGVPPLLRYIALPDLGSRCARTVVERGFATVRVVRLAGGSYWKVEDGRPSEVYLKGPGAVREWLEWIGCEDVVPRDSGAQFL